MWRRRSASFPHVLGLQRRWCAGFRRVDTGIDGSNSNSDFNSIAVDVAVTDAESDGKIRSDSNTGSDSNAKGDGDPRADPETDLNSACGSRWNAGVKCIRFVR